METKQSAISDLENGLTDPRFSTLQRYTRALGCVLVSRIEPGPSFVLYSGHIEVTAATARAAAAIVDYQEPIYLWPRSPQNQVGSTAADEVFSV
jgi:hypothetical protein